MTHAGGQYDVPRRQPNDLTGVRALYLPAHLADDAPQLGRQRRGCAPGTSPVYAARPKGSRELLSAATLGNPCHG